MKLTNYKKKVMLKDGTIKVYEYSKCYNNKIECDICKCKYSITNKSKHINTKKHQKNIPLFDSK